MSGAHRLVLEDIPKDAKGEAYLKAVDNAMTSEAVMKEDGCDEKSE